MLIGKFTHEGGDYYEGSLSCPFWRGATVKFSPVPVKQGSGPDLVVVCELEDDDDFELGVAWKKTSKAGRAYLSVKLDSPFFAEPINCALIKQQDGTYGLV